MTVSQIRKVGKRRTIEIAIRCNWTCHICGGGPDPDDRWEIDHVAPVAAMSGSDRDENLALAHQSCNRIKGQS